MLISVAPLRVARVPAEPPAGVRPPRNAGDDERDQDNRHGAAPSEQSQHPGGVVTVRRLDVFDELADQDEAEQQQGDHGDEHDPPSAQPDRPVQIHVPRQTGDGPCDPGEHDHAGDRGGQDAEAVDEVVHDIQNVDPTGGTEEDQADPRGRDADDQRRDRRVSSNLSRTADMTTSITLTSDVRPAKTNDPKNRTPISAPAGPR